MCLAQFAIMYDQFSEKEAQKIKFDNFHSSYSEKKIVSWDDSLENFLPMHIKLSTRSAGYMRLRSFPSVLRIHKHKFSIAPHEFFYSELMLYMPWRKESFLPSNDFQRALDLFSRKKEGQQKHL